MDVLQQFETFARIVVAPAGEPERRCQVDLAANWRLRPPIMMDIGLVLHPDDVAAGKMSALFTRAEPRDFLDVDALVTSGRYSREQLCELAAQADAGFSRSVLAELLGTLDRYPDRRFTAYDADVERIRGLRHRFAEWRRALTQP